MATGTRIVVPFQRIQNLEDEKLQLLQANIANALDPIVALLGKRDNVTLLTLPPPFGSFYQNNGVTTVVIDSIGVAVVAGGMLAGEVRSMTFQNGKELLVENAGFYKIDWTCSFSMVSGASLEIEGRIGSKGIAQAEGSAHRFIGTATDKGSMSGTAILDLAVDDRISIMVQNNTSTNNIIIDHANLAMRLVGRT